MVGYSNQLDDWRMRREQAQPIVNKVFKALTKKTRAELQREFLFRCKENGIVPKGLRVKTPVVGKGMGRKFDRVMLQRAIQKLNRDIINIDRNISSIRINLRDFNLGEKWVDDICNWSRKKCKKTSC